MISALAGKVLCDLGGGDTVLVPLGDDVCPLPGDSVVVFDGFVIAVIDEKNPAASLPGGRKLCSRFPDGSIAADIELSPTGAVKVSALGGTLSLTLDPLAGGVSIVSPTVTVTGTIVAAGISVGALTVGGVPVTVPLQTHTHMYTLDGVPTPTGGPVAPVG